MADGTDAVEKPADDPDVNRSPRDDFPGNDITSTEIDTECHRSYPCASPEDAMDQLLAGEQDLDECYPYETLSADDEDIVDIKLDERDGDHVPKDDGNDTRNKRDDEEEEEAPKDDSDTMNKPISAAKLAKTLKKRSIKCDPVLAAKWIRACGKDFNQPRPIYPRICSEHFSEKAYQRDLQHELLGLPLRRKLKPEAVPDKNLPKPIKSKPKASTEPIQSTSKLNNTKKLPALRKSLPTMKVRRFLKTGTVGKNMETTAASPDTLNKSEESAIAVLKEKEEIDRTNKVNNKVNRLPMRSSYRIAKKKSIECLSDSFVRQINTSNSRSTKFADKLKFMAKLQLRLERNENFIPLPQYDLKNSLQKVITNEKSLSASSYERDVQHELLGLPTRCRLKRGAVPDQNLPTDFLKEEKQPESAIAILLAVGLVPAKDTKTSGGGLPQDLNKMQIMENVREGCNANQPSSPGHAEQRQADGFDDAESKEETVKKEDPSENGVGTKEFAEGDSVTVKEEKEDKELKVEDKQEENSNSSTENNKRKLDNEELAIKKLKTDIQENFHSRDKIINEFCELSECNTPEQIQAVSEHLLAEIKTLGELAKEKEREWNQILHTRKLKEELLIRLQRKKNTLFIGDTDINDLQPEVNGQLSVLKCNQKPNSVKTVNVERSKQKNLLHTTKQSQFDLNSALDFRQKQRPTRDVQAIIADHRQRHPEAVPRRGRRIRHSQSDGKSSFLGFSGGSFASGQKPADHESASELGFLLNNMNGSRENSRSSTLDSYSQDTTSYQDILVQFAKLSQKEKNELQMHLQNNAKPPPPYPEVTVHPVNNTSSITPSNSLLHGILTKTPVKTSTNTSTNQNSKTSFSPTLARLLTAPERASSQVTSTPIPMGNTQSPGNMSLSDIIGSKARNEITITPVGNNQYESGSKADSPEDDSEEHPDRLIIDETTENSNSRQKDDNNSENGDDIPQCQGCNQKPAQFVCAGCGNQWYCSKDCQVSAWDEHSEVCSG